ncbi:c-type cytochrome biogenesis protein CcmI [Saccharospirillum mangrovi]|uniref:c-type cytochrome biogenesis protein CcmI n=1 Tax=Saccharospirillum mangrovi TaxID=2161747 RepID=UPI000D343979|nr:c-type cytochrome biogenesis protein CcmI [Saccharospirillum mangrovi]
MMVFVLMILTAWLFVLLAVRTGRSSRARDSVSESIAIHRERLTQLEDDFRQGQLDLADYQQFKAETERALLDDTRKEARGEDRRPLPWPLALAALVIIGAASWLLYQQWGASDAVEVRRGFVELATSEQPTQAELDATLDGYQALLQRHPDDLQGWFRLANMQMELGRYADAQPNLERVLRLLRDGGRNAEDEATILSYLGQSLWAQEQPDAALARFEEALQFDAQNNLALGFAGRLTFENGQYRRSIDYWQRLKNLTSADADTRLIDEFIRRAQLALAEQGIDYQPEQQARLQLDIQLPSAWEGLPDEAALFVYARRPGERMPLVAKRVPVTAQTMRLTLSDADAMTANGGLAGQSEVEVSARVSFSGVAQSAPGDWTAEPQRVDLSEKAQQQLRLQLRQP